MMKHVARSAAAMAIVLLLTPALASAVPITAPMDYGFYSIQLRGVSMDASGELVSIHVWDQTYDDDAFGRVKITDLTTNVVVIDFIGGDYGVYGAPGTFDVAPFLLPYGHTFQFDMSAQEYSQAALILGNTIVGIGGTWQYVYPTYSTTETIPEPGAWLLFAAGLGSALMRRRSRTA